MANETSTQVVKESPELEARKLGLMDTAAGMKMPSLPAYQVAGFSADQMAAMKLGQQGIGAYKPYLEKGSGMMNTAGTTAAQMGTYTGQMGAPAGQMGQVGNQIGQTASQMGDYLQADLGPAQTMMTGSVGQVQQAANQPGFTTAQGALGQGIGALSNAAQGYDPSQAQAFMNPYQQQVIDESMRQISRQGDIARTQQGARAAMSGAFGGGRQAVESAELERNLAEQKNAAITGALSQGYQSSQQAAMQAFEAEKQRQLAQAQGYQGAASVGGNLAGTQANIGMQAGQYQGQMGQALGAQNIQQAQLGQSGTAQQAGILGQQAGVYGQQAGIYGQQASLAGQQAATQATIGQGIAGLGAQAQALGQNDVNFLYNIGSQQQGQTQREVDALRQTNYQNAMQPYQHLGFVSDIYKGAPSTQMAVTQNQAPSPSVAQQIGGLAIGAGATAKALGGI